MTRLDWEFIRYTSEMFNTREKFEIIKFFGYSVSGCWPIAKANFGIAMFQQQMLFKSHHFFISVLCAFNVLFPVVICNEYIFIVARTPHEILQLIELFST